MINFRAIDDEAQLVDALTGSALRAGAGKCRHCGVFYNIESVSELMASNSGKCVACEQPFEAAARE
ncbi:hypothetical protein [Burkholderia stabilis]|uniref:hypothetical protein n=1 Tax=Burkholderia stabilis TaxID=95485 RepID=UPI000AB21041|nr:hypothetical protein [Burkholderia stabilis]